MKLSPVSEKTRPILGTLHESQGFILILSLCLLPSTPPFPILCRDSSDSSEEQRCVVDVYDHVGAPDANNPETNPVWKTMTNQELSSQYSYHYNTPT